MKMPSSVITTPIQVRHGAIVLSEHRELAQWLNRITEIPTESVFSQNLDTDWTLFQVAAGIFRTKRILTDDQIKALPTTPIDVVPILGANKVIIPLMVSLQLTWVANYTNIDPNSSIRITPSGTPGGGGALLVTGIENPSFAVSGALAAGYSTFQLMMPDFGVDALSTSSMIPGFGLTEVNSLGLKLWMNNQASGNLTGGDPGNKLIVNTFYTGVDSD